MKTLIIFLLCALSAHAQYSVNTTLQTNRVVTSGATSNYTTSTSIARTRYLAARVSITTTNESASGNFYTLWQTSLDNTNWGDAFVITNTVSGTNIVASQTNHFDIGSLQYLRLARSTNNATHEATNFYATVTYKVSVAQDVISAIGYDVMPASTTLSNWAILPESLFQRADSDLTNWASISDTVFQRAHRMLTNVANTNGFTLPTSWTNIANIPVGFADGTDDGGGGAPAELWELDGNGDLQPNTETAAAGGWELDGNGDLQPEA